MLPKLRTLLRGVARTLRRQPAVAAGLDRWRIELLLNAIARNLRHDSDDLPPSFAMLEVLVREVPSEELAALIGQLEDDDGERVLALLRRMREGGRAEGAVAIAEPVQQVEVGE